MNAQEPAYPFPQTLFEQMALTGAQWSAAARVRGGGSHGSAEDKGAFSQCSRAEACVAAAPGTAAPSSGPGRLPVLAKGQLWKLRGGYVEIVALDPKLVHYRVVKERGQKALTRVLKCQVFESYLQDHAAVLMN